MSDPNPLPPIEALLPHRGTMQLLDRVIAFWNDSATAEYTPRGDAWYADAEGNMPAWIGIELMAQTIAAHVGLLKRRERTLPKPGVLLGTHSYTSAVPCFAAGKALLIHATMSYHDASGLGAYDCSIARGNEKLAKAMLKVYEPEDFQIFFQGSLA